MRRDSLVPLVESLGRWTRDCAYVHRRGYRTERWSYHEVLRVARQFARELQQRGIQRGDRILLWGDNCAEWAAAFYGCVLHGAVVVPMDRGASADFAHRVAEQVSARLVVVSRDLANVFYCQQPMILESLRTDLSRLDAAPYESPALTRSDLLEIVFTSGTTSDPKGVAISHGNVLANLEPIETEIEKYRKYERFVHPLRFLNLLPLSHVFGQFLGLFIPPVVGAAVVFHNSVSPGEVIQVIHDERVSVLIAVPRMLESLKAKLERDYEVSGNIERFRRRFAAGEGKNFISNWWRFRDVHNRFGWKFWAVISGGAALDEATERFWSRLAFAVVQGYGLTETTSLISLNHPFKVGQRSIGKVLPGREMKLDESGEILVRGESLASGYWQGNTLTPVAGDEGWFRTGDLGELDSEGNLYFKGRKKNVIVTPAGMNVYPEDLEHALRAHAGVRDCVVLGIPVAGNAEACAVLLLAKGADATEAVRTANKQLAEYQQIRRWLVWPEQDFPRTSTQKPKLGEIESWARAQLTAEGAGGAPQSAVAELLERITGKRTEALRGSAQLESDLNLSSIDRVELMSALEERYQVSLDEQSFSHATTVGEVERMLREAAPEPRRYEFPRWALAAPVRWIRTLVYHALTWPATLIMTKPRVVGRERLHGVEGPLLIISNHVTFLDIGFILWALPWRLRTRSAVAMLGERLMSMRHPPRERGWFLSLVDHVAYVLVVALFNVFPLFQRHGFRESFAYAGEAVDRDYSVVVFPEGRRTEDGALTPFQSGVGMLATKLDVPVLPMRIDGLWEAKQRHWWFVRPNAITVRIGEPVNYEPTQAAEEIAKDLEMRVRDL